MTPNAQLLYTYWFGTIDSSKAYLKSRMEIWFQKNETTDRYIRNTFAPWLTSLRDSEVQRWTRSKVGALALLVLWDQVPRNSFRNQAKAFAWDAKALAFAKSHVGTAFEKSLEVPEANFLYLPLEHSESLEDQRLSVRCFEAAHQRADKAWQAYTAQGVDYAHRHFRIIERFGRYPHRNAALGRASTPEEIEFLKGPDSSF